MGLKELHLDEGQECRIVRKSCRRCASRMPGEAAAVIQGRSVLEPSFRACDISSLGSGGLSMTVTSQDLSPPPSVARAAGGKNCSKEAGSATRGRVHDKEDGSDAVRTLGTPGGTAHHSSSRPCCTPRSNAWPAASTCHDSHVRQPKGIVSSEHHPTAIIY